MKKIFGNRGHTRDSLMAHIKKHSKKHSFPPDLEKLLMELYAPEPGRITNAAEALLNVSDYRIAEPLELALKLHPNYFVRSSAAIVLGKIGKAKDVGVLKTALKKDSDLRVRGLAASSLCELNKRGVIRHWEQVAETLIDALKKEENNQARELIANALKTLAINNADEHTLKRIKNAGDFFSEVKGPKPITKINLILFGIFLGKIPEDANLKLWWRDMKSLSLDEFIKRLGL